MGFSSKAAQCLSDDTKGKNIAIQIRREKK